MYLIEVVPASRLPRSLPDTFSYFSQSPIEPGSAVLMRIQSRALIGVVVRSSPVKDVKQELRRAAYTLRKIERILTPTPILNARDLEFVARFSEVYLTSPAVVLRFVLPPAITNTKVISALPPRPDLDAPNLSSTEVLIGHERFKHYLDAITKALEQEKQVLCVTPELIQAARVYRELSEHLGSRVTLVTSETSQKALRDIWLSVRAGESMAVVGTHVGLFLPYTKLGLIVVDDDGSPYHKSWDQEPRYHNRTVGFMLQTLHGAKMILAGAPPSLDAYEKAKRDPTTTLSVLNDAEPHPLSVFADMQKEIKEAGEFVIFSQVVKDKLRGVLREGGRAFLFVNRKGFAPFILCQECGEAIRCTNCAAPLVYHAQESLHEPTLLCHHCSAKQPVPDVCANCGSHRLKMYGIGVERVTRELRKLFPGTPVIAAKADEESLNVRKGFLARIEKISSYIVVGTEYAISKGVLPQGELAAIISIDTALHLPDFLQNERLFRILSLVRRLGQKHFILQSYSKEPELLYDLFHGTFEHFAEKELKERRRFSYPPFGELIKVTIRDTRRETALERVKRLRLLLEGTTRRHGDAVEITNPYPAYIEKKRGYFIFHILIKITKKEETDAIKQTLRELLPTDITIDVEPNTLL